MNLEEGLRSKPCLSFVAHQWSEVCLVVEGRADEELGKASPLFGRASSGPTSSFPEWVNIPHQFWTYTHLRYVYLFYTLYRY